VSLPEELLQLVVSFLSTADLKNLALVSRDAYSHATGSLWRTVNLVDTTRTRPFQHNLYTDEHDDTPIIQKLYILAKYWSPLLSDQPTLTSPEIQHWPLRSKS
jgi:hypothetical protein